MVAADDPRNDHIPGAPYLTTEELRRDVSALREILQARLDGMDRATELLSETVTRTPTQIQTEISHVRELIQEKLGSLGGQAEEKFASIELQFVERDVRTNQAATASAQALAAALQAAKEAVFEQAQAAAKAADKTELSFTKQIDLLLAQIKALSDTFTDRLAELKERIDRGEGQEKGTATAVFDQRAIRGNAISSVQAVIMGVAILISLVSVIAFVLKK
jgi:hypothetical protein